MRIHPAYTVWDYLRLILALAIHLLALAVIIGLALWHDPWVTVR